LISKISASSSRRADTHGIDCAAVFLRPQQREVIERRCQFLALPPLRFRGGGAGAGKNDRLAHTEIWSEYLLCTL
jgi:hypothetical protein